MSEEDSKPFDPTDLSDVVLPMPPTWSESESEDEGAGARVAVSREDLRKSFEESLAKMKEATHHMHSDRSIHESSEYKRLLQGILDGSAIRERGHIQRKAVADAKEKFLEEHVTGSVPVMLSGIPEEDEWRALAKWKSAEAFLEHYGNVPFKVTEFASEHGIGKALAVRLPMFMYEEYTRNNTADFPFYSFEADFEGERYSLLGDYRVHSLFRDDLYETTPETRLYFPRYRYMIIGGDRTGTNLHIDPAYTGAWNTLLCGKKLWVLFPPGDDPAYKERIGATMYEYKKVPPAYWWLDVYGRIKSNRAEEEELGMIECVQNEGDTIFVPGGWWHVVINVGFTVAITQNLLFPVQLPAVWPRMKEENPSVAHQFARFLSQERPHVTAGVPDIAASLESTVLYEL